MSAGKRGALTEGQVRALQVNLNERLRARGRRQVHVDGNLGPATAQAVHVVKYLLGFPTSSLNTGPSRWFRHLVGHPGRRPPTYLVRAAVRAHQLTSEHAAATGAAGVAGEFGVDWAWGTPNILQLKASNVKFACRYLSHDTSKNLTPGQAKQLAAAGIDVVVVWEDAANRALGGFPAGKGDAETALAELKAFGSVRPPVYFAVDFDATPAQQAAINAYMDGAASVLSHSRVGAYGGYHVIKRLFDAGKIALGWQTYAWSGGAWDHRAQLQQYSNGHTLAGVSCDFNRSTTSRYGQWRP